MSDNRYYVNYKEGRSNTGLLPALLRFWRFFSV